MERNQVVRLLPSRGMLWFFLHRIFRMLLWLEDSMGVCCLPLRQKGGPGQRSELTAAYIYTPKEDWNEPAAY